MSSSDIYSSFTESFFESYHEHVCYVSLPGNSVKQLIASLKKDATVIDMEKDFSPLKPFLEILSMYRPSEFLIEEKSYILQKNTFKSYLKYGFATERTDIFVPIEIYYEKLRCRKTILELLKSVPDAKFVILNAQFICEEAIDIIRELEKIETQAKFVFCFDTERMDNCTEVMTKFFDSISNNKNFFTISELDSDEKQKDSKLVSKTNVTDFDVIYNSLRNNRMFVSLDQGCQISDWIAKDIGRFGFNKLQNRSLFMEMALCYFYAGRYDTASFYLNNVIKEQRDDELDIEAIFFSCQVFSMKNANASALKYANLVIEKLRNNKGSQYYAYGRMMEYIIMEQVATKSSLDKYNESLNLLMDHGFVNNCLTTMLTMPWAYVDDSTKYVQMISKLDEAEKLARKLNNNFGLSTACHWKGIICSKMGKMDEANRLYLECNDIRTEIGEMSAIIKIRNGLSYEYLMTAQFRKSFELINGFVERLNELSDYPEIIITLQNVARSLFFSRHFDEAYPLYGTIMHLLNLLSLNERILNSFLPEYNDILVYKSLIDFYNGDIIRAKINHHNISHSGKPMTYIDKPLLLLLKSFIDLSEKKINAACEEFQKVIEETRQFGMNEDYRVVFMYYEFACWLDKYGYKIESDRYLKEGFSLALERGMDYFTKGKTSGVTIDDYRNNIEPFKALNVNLSYIEEKAEKECLVNQLHGRLRDSQFLNRIMSFGGDITSYKSYAERVLQALFDYTTAEAIVISKKTSGKWEQLSSIFRSNVEVPAEKELEKLLRKSKSNGNLLMDKQRGWYVYDISKFDYEGLIFIAQNEASLFSPEELNILNIAITSVQSQLVMYMQNEYLTYMSSIDQLSQLKNRRALDEFIELEDKKLRRYNSKKLTREESVCFVDLDNFKFYNDNYGHEAGDLLIAGFAAMLKKVFREVDFIGRFGGDEFIVILPETNCKDAKKICSRLYKALENKNFFLDELEDLIGSKVNVEPENRLGFSAGISSNFDAEEYFNLSEVLNKADHALYYSKQNGKGKASIWSEIKDFLTEESNSDMHKGC